MGVLEEVKKVVASLPLIKSRKSVVVGGAYAKYYGDYPPLGVREAVSLFKQDPVIFGAINRLADWISATGYEFYIEGGRTSGERKLRKVEEWANRIKFKSKIRNLALTHLLFDDVFVEISPKNKDFYVLDTETVRIVYDEKGRVIKYIQEVDGKKVEIPPSRIAHFKMNTAGSELRGLSPLVPLYRILKDKELTERYTEEFFRKHATPRLIYKMPETWSDEQMKTFIQLLRTLSPHADIVVPNGVDVEKVGSAISDMQFRQWLEYLREQILIAMGLYPILLGLPEGSNRANSNIQFLAFKLRVRAVQNEIEAFINTELLPKIFPGWNVKFRFKEIDLDEKARKAEIFFRVSRGIANLVKFGVLTPEEAKKKLEELTEGL